jgi:hypothetical protein
MKRILHLTLLLSIFIIGCEKTMDVSKYDPHPLTLKVLELQGNTYKISWNALSTSDFIDYQLIRAIHDTVPDMLPNDTLFRTSSLVARIGDKEQTTFFDSVTIAGRTVSFRLFARYRDHSVSSINVTLKGHDNIIEIPNLGDQIFYSPKNNLFILADKVKDRLTTLDLGGNILRDFTTFLDDASHMSLGNDPFGEPALYAANIFGSMNIINPLTLVSDRQIFTNSRNPPFSVGGNEAWAYCSVFENPINIININTIRLFQHSSFGTQVSFENFPNATPRILFQPPGMDELFAVEANSEKAEVIVFRNINTDALRNPMTYNADRFHFVDVNRLEFAPDGSFLVTGRQGNIYNRQMVLSKPLNIHGNYNSFYMDNHLNIYAATRQRIDIFNAPHYNWTRSVSCRTNPNKIFVVSNEAYLFAPSANKVGNTMLEKILL